MMNAYFSKTNLALSKYSKTKIKFYLSIHKIWEVFGKLMSQLCDNNFSDS